MSSSPIENWVIDSNQVPEPSTPDGARARDLFETSLLAILGDTRLLYMPRPTETLTSTGRSRNLRTLTYNADVAGTMTTLGSGTSLNFNGTADEADMPDTDNMSFGDSANDEPFSVLAVLRLTDATSSSIISKHDTAGTLREWQFYFDSSDRPTFLVYDESEDASISRRDATGWAQNEWGLFVGTYDGSGASTGISLFGVTETTLAFARIDDTTVDSGTYTAMENTATLPFLGAANNTTPDTFFDGDMAMVAVCAKALNIDEVWDIKVLVNHFHGLSL